MVAKGSRDFKFCFVTLFKGNVSSENYLMFESNFYVKHSFKSDCRWRCNAAPGSMLHIWWDCPLLLPFWESIFTLYNNLAGSNVTASASLGLLSMLPGSISSLKKGLLKHFLTAVRTIIPRRWKSSIPPSREEWLVELNSLMRMESLMADDTGKTEVFIRTWSVWSMFQEGQSATSWLATGSLD